MPPASIQQQSNIDEKQKNNDDIMYQVQQQQSVHALMDIFEQQPSISNGDNDVDNRFNKNSVLSDLVSTAQCYPAVWDITTQNYQDLHKNSHGKI